MSDPTIRAALDAVKLRIIYTTGEFYITGWKRRPDLDRPGYAAWKAWETPAAAVEEAAHDDTRSAGASSDAAPTGAAASAGQATPAEPAPQQEPRDG